MRAFSLFSFCLYLLCSANVLAQTSYTWNGSSSTDFATATNWTPNGVPGSGDNITVANVTNDPVLDGNRTVNNLTLNSGAVLDMDGHTLTVNGTATLNAGTVTDGLFYKNSGSVDFSGVDMNCKVDVTANILKIYWSSFADTAKLKETEGGGYYMMGSRFDAYTEITNSSTGYVRTGNGVADTFMAPVVFNLDAAGYIVFGHNAVGTYFADEVTLNNHSGNTARGFTIGANTNSTNTFASDITMNVSSGSGYINFNVGTNTHAGNLLIGSEGYASGILTLNKYTQTSALPIDLSAMSGTSSVVFGNGLRLNGSVEVSSVNTSIGSGCVFEQDVSFPSVFNWYGSRFEGKAELGVTYTGALYTGGNVFLDTATVSRTAASYLYMGNTSPDTFQAPVTFNLEAAGYIYLSRTSNGNLYADDVILNNHSGNTARGFMIGTGTSTTVFEGDIEMNVDSTSGYINFYQGTTTHNGQLRIGDEGYHSGLLTLDAYTQTASGTMDLTAMDHNSTLSILTHADITADLAYNGPGTATLTGATFRGNVDIESPSLPVTYSEFYGTTRLEKTGTVNNLNGGNVFRGNTTIENSSSGNYLYWGNSVTDTILGDLTLINRSSQPLWMSYGTTGHYAGDVTLDGDSLSIIRFGSSTVGRVAVFNGTSDQHLSIVEPDLNVQLYRVGVDKSSGRLKVNNDVTVSYELALTDGIIECINDAVITLNDGVAPTARDDSYVEGAVKKVGNDAFTFPVGRNGHYRPIGISAPSNVTYAFTAEYFNENVHAVHDTSLKEVTLAQISTNDYWTLTRNVGTSNVAVTLSWDDMSCEITDLGDLLVAAWDSAGPEWVDYGNGGTTGDTVSGTITTAGPVSDFLAFALATDDSFECVPCRADAGEDTSIFSGEFIKIGTDTVACSGCTYAWTPSDWLNETDLNQPQLMAINVTGTSLTIPYTLEKTNATGCTALDGVNVTVASGSAAATDSSLSAYRPNFYRICEEMEAQFTELQIDTAEDGLAARFGRWRDFWEPRAYTEDQARKGDINYMSGLYSRAGVDMYSCINENLSTHAWEPIGPMTLNTAHHGLVPAIYVDRNDENTVYVGSRGGGIFKTTNALAQNPEWVNITDMRKIASVGFQSIIVSDDQEKIVASAFTGMGGWTNEYSIGVAYSDDEGENWMLSQFNDEVYESIEGDAYGSDRSIVKLVRHNYYENVIYAISRYRLYRSDDHGLTFTRVCFNPLPSPTNWVDYGFADVEVDSRTDSQHRNKVYISGIVSGMPVIYQLTIESQNPIDGGQGFYSTLSNLADGLSNSVPVTDIMIEHVGGNLVTMYNRTTVNPTRIDLWENNGWQNLSNPAIPLRGSVFVASPNLQTIYVESDNGWGDMSGRTLFTLRLNNTTNQYDLNHCNWFYWSGNGTGNRPHTHADIRAVSVVRFGQNGNSDELFVAHDGGVSYSSDTQVGSFIWRRINGTGLNNNDFFNVSVLEDERYTSYYGAQDNGFFTLNANMVFSQVNDGDGYERIRNQEIVIPTWQSHNNGGTGSYFPYDPTNAVCTPVSGEFNTNNFHGTRIEVDANNQLYVGWRNVYQFDFNSPEGGTNCNRMSDFENVFAQGPLLEHNIRAIHANRTNPDRLYVAMMGQTWARQMNAAPVDGAHPTCLGGESCLYGKLFARKWVNNEWKWEDIGHNMANATGTEGGQPTNTQALAWFGLWDVVTAADDPDKIWVSFGGINTENKIRVFYSPDGGESWEGYSDGLPMFPVGRLVYQEGSNDLLYAATDVGVFYRDATMDSWECYSNQLPVTVVSDIEIDYCERKLYASTIGRGAWYVDLIEDNAANELLVSSNETWDTDKRIWQQLITVESGNTLTIDGTSSANGHIDIKLPKDCKIVVEEGAKLLVKNATLTNVCGYMWHGIEVWGDPNAEPDATLPSAQGILKLEDGAIIENAVLGLYLGTWDDCCTKSGGIVRSTGGTDPEDRVVFRNNRKHVAFGPYNYNSHSYFTRTDFICDAPMQDFDAYQGAGSQQFVSIWDQDHIRFTDCVFENSLTGTADEFEEPHRGMGIRAIDAKVYVYSSAPDGDTYHTRFTGLTSGIHISRTLLGGAKLGIDEALFDNTIQGILSEGSVADQVVGNKFLVANPGLYGGTLDWGYGVYMYDGMSHTLVDNTFDSYDTENPALRGYISRGPTYTLLNTGGLAWKNTFNNIFASTQTEQYNRALELRCNTYQTGNGLDWAINPQSTWGLLGPQGTNCFEFDPETDYRAGNVFNDAMQDVEHIWTWTQPFAYYASGETGTVPNANTPEQNLATQDCEIPEDGSCDEDPDILTPLPYPTDAAQMVAYHDSVLDVLATEKSNVVAYLDSGMTDTLLTHIWNSGYDKAVLTAEMLQYSFLSDTVLNAACVRTPFFTEPQFQAIMINNAPVSHRVWPYLKEAFSNLKQEYIDTILGAYAIDTLQTIGSIEKEEAISISQRFSAIASVIAHYYEFDTIPDSTFALIGYLEELPDIQYKRLAVGISIGADTLGWARSILDSIPLETADDSTFYEYYDLALDLREDTLTWLDADDTQRGLITSIATGNSSVKHQAEAVLMLLDDTTYVRIPEQLQGEPSGKWGDDEDPAPHEQLASDTRIQVFPNPFENQFNIAWELEKEEASLQFEVFDLTGRLVHTETVAATKVGQRMLTLGECKGFYILRASENGRELKKEKLLCIGR